MRALRREWIFLPALVVALVACGTEPYQTGFDETGSWGTGSTPEVEGRVIDGVYEMFVTADNGLFWATASENLANGIYEIEGTAVEGPLDNGYGLIFMMDPEENDFYLFEVSSDGYVWIGRCEGGCEEDIVFLVDNGWFASPTVKRGIGETNRLRVEVVDGSMAFFINGQPVGEATDNALVEGEIGVAVETYGVGGVRVRFDNFSYVPAGQ